MVIEFLIADCLLVNIITPFIQKKYFLSGKQYFNKSFNTEVNRTNYIYVLDSKINIDMLNIRDSVTSLVIIEANTRNLYLII